MPDVFQTGVILALPEDCGLADQTLWITGAGAPEQAGGALR
jgi:hypothetical protein